MTGCCGRASSVERSRRQVSEEASVNEFRIEKDTMGEVRVPAHAYYGAQTQRAVENFPISGLRFPRRFIQALGMIKWAAARVNEDLGLLEPGVADLIRRVADEVASGRLDGEFVLDVFQTGSGTSTNMNANEVIANRAIEIVGGERGSKEIHPNDHVNLGQSSNDVIPTTIRLATLLGIAEGLIPALERLRESLRAKALEFDDVVKVGRTHLMDATPVRLGQEFSGYAAQVGLGLERLRSAMERLAELPLGGTAVGTGLNAHPEFAPRVIALLAERTGLPVREAADHFEAQGSQDALVEVSGVLKMVAVSLMKVANDVRWMGSGPRAGIGELRLPSLQPGSSIMPGKVNPVIPEVVRQVAAQVIGNDAVVTIGGALGEFELNVMMPVMAHNVLQSVDLLTSAATVFREKCVGGLEADAERARALVEQSFPIITALVPKIGYEAAADIAKEALATGRGVREIAAERGILPPEELEEALDVRRMTEGGILTLGGE
ncbi:MAG: class II fumarate hydratase [Actinomycetota bacterium]